MNDKTMPELPEPHGWYLLTGHGNSYANQRPQRLMVDAWKPAYGAAQMHAYALAYAAAQTPPSSERVESALTGQLAQGWRGIESAPRDGTAILLLMDGAAIEGGWGSSGEWRVVVMHSHGCGCCAYENPEPTHWMPLPAPPQSG